MQDPDREPRRSPPSDSKPARRQPLDDVDQMSVESFPASDAPSFTPVSGAGAPEHDDETDPEGDGPQRAEQSGDPPDEDRP